MIVIREDNLWTERARLLIEKNTPLPAEHSESFGTAVDNQQIIEMELVQGDSEEPEECVRLGPVTLQFPPGLPRGSEIQVTYRMEQDGILQVIAVEQVHGSRCTFTIECQGAKLEI